MRYKKTVKKRGKSSRNKKTTITGTLMKTKKGFGFVVTEEDGKGDIFIPRSGLNGAMHGDLVEALVYPESMMYESKDGEIVRVLKRANLEIAGDFEQNKKIGRLIPENSRIDEDILIAKKHFNGAQNGDKIIVKIAKYPESGCAAGGVVTEIISRAGERGGDIKVMIRERGFDASFPAKVEMEAKSVIKKPCNADGRTDLRGKSVITIDGEDAKDLDDAVSIEKNEKGNFILGVHIADVSFYVEEGRALDREALKRGTSIYLIDQVVPMLPKALSNGICSLNKGEDRLALSIDMEITPRGKIVSHDIYESVIRSSERMVYTDVSDILENKCLNLIEKYDSIYDEILMMDELATILKKRRIRRGSLDFDLDESLIRLDSEGRAEIVEPAERRVANGIIEEFMLAANETVAEHFFHLGIPFVYRVHEKPAVEKIEEFKEFIANFGLTMKDGTESIHPLALSGILKDAEGEVYEGVLNMMLLRSMKKAFYNDSCGGHFGLGLKYYCHFTAPIRRYPDLMIHRIIKESLSGEIVAERVKTLREKTAYAAEISSATERKAIELERDVEKMKKAEFMSRHIGETFNGVVSGITPYGVYVQLPNTVEGMIRTYGGETELSPGDKLQVTVKSADVKERQIDFIASGC